jgi:predicted AAA+ superfamily ATPase
MEFRRWDQELFYWRISHHHVEVDFVSYGTCGLFVFEIKRAYQLQKEDLKGWSLFKQDYPTSTCCFWYGGDQELYQKGIFIKNFGKALLDLPQLFSRVAS